MNYSIPIKDLPNIESINYVYTFDDILRQNADSWNQALFFFWMCFFVFIVGERHKNVLFKGELLKYWDESAFTFIFVISLFYPLVYILYG